MHAGERLVWGRVIQNWWTMYACHVARVCDPEGRFAHERFRTQRDQNRKTRRTGCTDCRRCLAAAHATEEE